MGPDKGTGAMYLVLSPGMPEPEGVPEGWRTVQSTGVNVLFGFRTLDPDPQRAGALVAAVRVYPFSERDAPPPTRGLSPDGKPWSGDQPRGFAYWKRLHAIYQSELVDERDRFYLAVLKQLGIEKGKPFAPDARLTEILEQGAAAGKLMAQANTFAKHFEQGSYLQHRTSPVSR